MDIKVEFTAGTSIEQAADDAQALADRILASISFRFNDVQCYIKPGGSAAYFVSSWYKCVQDKSGTYKFASSL